MSQEEHRNMHLEPDMTTHVLNQSSYHVKYDVPATHRLLDVLIHDKPSARDSARSPRIE